jgi:intracellular multiplication protein IcmE
MTNNHDEHENNDDFNEPEIGQQEQPRGMGGNLAEAWRTRPMFKFMVLIIAVFAVFVAGFSFLGGGNNTAGDAHVLGAPKMHEAAGGAASPFFQKQTQLANDERVDHAVQTGGSAIQTPIGQSADVGNFDNSAKKDDALTELRAETEKLRQQVQQQQAVQVQQQQQVQQQKPEQFDNTLAEAMQGQMKQLLESWKPHGMAAVEVTKPSDIKAEQDRAEGVSAAGNGAKTLVSSVEDAKPTVSAGTVSYAQLLTEANSDVPGPILAQIVSGPLAGARAVGGFQVSQGYEKYLVLKFSLADKKGKDYSINAIALDPNTTLGGMATEVDERYFVRVVLPAAAGFLQGMGQALGQGNTSITTSGDTTSTTIASNGFRQGVYNGLGQASQTMGQFFQNQANLTKPLVRVASGTPIGMFFVAPVYEPGSSGASAVNATQQNTASPGNTNYSGNGYGNGYGNNGGNSGYSSVSGYGTNSNAASGAPYPNYAVPGYGYSPTTTGNRGLNTNAGSSGNASYGQNYGQ